MFGLRPEDVVVLRRLKEYFFFEAKHEPESFKRRIK